MSELKHLAEEYSQFWTYTDKMHRGGLSDFAPAIVTCAITGGNQGKEANPNLPETLEEQVQSTYEAYKAGAVMVHIHRRDPNNTRTRSTDPEEYREVNIKIREKCPDIIINNTCLCGAAVVGGQRQANMSVSLTAAPEVASIDTSCYRAGNAFYTITDAEVRHYAEEMGKLGTKPEFECFQLVDVWYLKKLIESGYVDAQGGPHWLQFVFTKDSNWPVPDFMSMLVRSMPANTVLGIIAAGAQQWPVLAQGLIWGANVRVGMEDNIYIGRGKLADSNAQLVEKIIRIANDLGRRVATCEQARAMLGLGAPRTW